MCGSPFKSMSLTKISKSFYLTSTLHIYFRYSHKNNLTLTDTAGENAVTDSLKHFKAAGGGCIVENSTYGMNRNSNSLKQISIETGLHIIAGTGNIKVN